MDRRETLGGSVLTVTLGESGDNFVDDIGDVFSFERFTRQELLVQENQQFLSLFRELISFLFSTNSGNELKNNFGDTLGSDVLDQLFQNFRLVSNKVVELTRGSKNVVDGLKEVTSRGIVQGLFFTDEREKLIQEILTTVLLFFVLFSMSLLTSSGSSRRRSRSRVN